MRSASTQTHTRTAHAAAAAIDQPTSHPSTSQEDSSEMDTTKWNKWESFGVCVCVCDGRLVGRRFSHSPIPTAQTHMHFIESRRERERYSLHRTIIITMIIDNRIMNHGYRYLQLAHISNVMMNNKPDARWFLGRVRVYAIITLEYFRLVSLDAIAQVFFLFFQIN